MDMDMQIAEKTPIQPIKLRFLRGIVRLAADRLKDTYPVFSSAQAFAGATPFGDNGARDAGCWIERAAEVLVTNIESGRFEHAQAYLDTAPGSDASLLSYATQILRVLVAESDRVEQLKDGHSAAWAGVIDRMERVAYRWLGPEGRSEWAAWEARDVTARTCADLWAWLQEHPYPFDVPFDRWATRALYNRLQEAARKQRTRERHIAESLDRPLFGHSTRKTYGDVVADVSFDLWLEQSANREALLQALEGLNLQQAQIIRWWYLEQWPADEIAAALDIRVNYVYVQRFRAIEKLRKIALSDERLGLADILTSIEEEKRRSRPAMGKSDPQEEDPLS